MTSFNGEYPTDSISGSTDTDTVAIAKTVVQQIVTPANSIVSSTNATSNIQANIVEKDKDDSTEPQKAGFWNLYSKHKVVGLLCLMVAFGGFVFGWDTGTISGYIQMENFKEKFGDFNNETNKYEIGTTKVGLIISIFNIGCAVGGLTLAKLGDMYGRKVGLMAAMTVYIIGIILQISASHWAQLMIGRIVGGLAVGTVSVLSPMFIAETAPSEIRGIAVAFYQLMITLGILLGYITTFGTVHSFSDDRQWRIPLGLCFAWALIMIGGMCFLPESSRFLIEKGKMEKAKKSIAKVNNLLEDSEIVAHEIEEINAAITEQREAGEASWKEVFTGKPHLCTRLIIGIMLQSFQQLTGNNFFFYYGTSIFQSIGLDDSYVTSIILGAVNFGSTLISLYTVGKASRRNNLIFGAIGMSVCLLTFSIIGVTVINSDKSSDAGIGMIVLTCIFIFVFAITWAPGVFIVVSETYPLRIRAKGMALATAANWIWGFLIAFFTPMIISKIKFAYGFVFTGCTIVAGLFVYFMVPETSGLTLEQVDTLYKHYKLGAAAHTLSLAQDEISAERDESSNSFPSSESLKESSIV